MASSYCWCYSLETGVTLIGFLHLNAALYFWARASTFEPIYVWLDILIAAMYTIRATYFFVMLSLDASADSKKDYFNFNKYTTWGLLGCGLSMILTRWLEWAHPPTWTIVAWAIVGGLNYYHYDILKEYAGVTGDTFWSRKAIADSSRRETQEEEGTALYAVNKIE